MFHVIAFSKCPSNELSVTWLYLFIKPVCAACFKAKSALAARDPVFSASQSGSVHSEVCFLMCCEFSAHLRPQRAPVMLFHISIIFNILMGKCWQYIYIYAFGRRFYPKRLTLHSCYSFYILSALAFPGNRTHDLGVASAMLYHFTRFEMRRVCKPLFTEAGVFRQNKSSTAVSAKIKLHRFISCKQGLKWTDANKENIVQAEQAHCL